MPDDAPSNVTYLPAKPPLGPVQMSTWFHRLASHLGRDLLTMDPTAFVLVLINEDAVQCYSAGPSQLRDEAALAAQDAQDHQREPGRYDPPEVVRARRRATRQAREAAEPYVCEVCQRRVPTAHDLEAHHTAGHVCMTCQQVWYGVEAWWEHPCGTPAVDPPPALRILPRQVKAGADETTERRGTHGT